METTFPKVGFSGQGGNKVQLEGARLVFARQEEVQDGQEEVQDGQEEPQALLLPRHGYSRL